MIKYDFILRTKYSLYLYTQNIVAAPRFFFLEGSIVAELGIYHEGN